MKNVRLEQMAKKVTEMQNCVQIHKVFLAQGQNKS